MQIGWSTGIALGACIALLSESGCRRKPAPVSQEEEQTGEQTVPPNVEAQQIFATRCTPCHGATGSGDGAASASLNPHPRNFHDPAWQAATPDANIERIIQYGGASVGKSPAMPANPDLTSKPLVVSALRQLIRGFRQQ